MKPDLWRRAERLLHRSLRLPPEERETFLAKACGDDPALRQEVISLLAHSGGSDDSLEQPLVSLRPEDNDDGEAEGPPPPTEGSRVGPYRLGRRLGRGGMGRVFLAVRDDHEFDMEVAIKLLRRGLASEEIVARFRRERQILAHLDHPNIGKLLDGGTTDDGLPYLVMEYVKGEPIDVYCDRCRLSTRQRVALVRTICEAVSFAHRNLVVHRDLKPGNILVTAAGVPKLLDFGIARLVTAEALAGSLQALTHETTARFIGTLRYACPEQLGQGAITTICDIYSLGVVLYELLTGHHPYASWDDSLIDIVQAIGSDQAPDRPSAVIHHEKQVSGADHKPLLLSPESVSATRDGSPEALEHALLGDLDCIVLKALAKDPRNRYGTADQLSEDLDRYLEGKPVLAHEPTLLYQVGKFVRRHRYGVAAGAAALLMIVAFALTMTMMWQTNDRLVRLQEGALETADFAQSFFVLDSNRRSSLITARNLIEWKRRDLLVATAADSLPEDEKADIADQLPRDTARLMDIYGWALYGLRASLDALPWLRQALERRRADPATLANDLVASQLHTMAALSAIGYSSAADALLREAIGHLRRGAIDSQRMARALNELGLILEDRNDLRRAELLLREAMAMKRRLYGDQAAASIEIGLNNLAAILDAQGKYDDAVETFEHSLRLKLARYPQRSLAVARTQANLGKSLRDLGIVRQEPALLERAEDLLARSLETRRQVDGDDAPSVAIVRNHLALLYQHRGRPGAEENYAAARRIFDRADYPLGVAVVERNWATLLHQIGQLEEAERLARNATEALEEICGPDHWRTADAESVLGGGLLALGRLDDAAPLLHESYAILRDEKGDGARETIEAKARLEELAAARRDAGAPR